MGRRLRSWKRVNGVAKSSSSTRRHGALLAPHTDQTSGRTSTRSVVRSGTSLQRLQMTTASNYSGSPNRTITATDRPNGSSSSTTQMATPRGRLSPPRPFTSSGLIPRARMIGARTSSRCTSSLRTTRCQPLELRSGSSTRRSSTAWLRAGSLLPTFTSLSLSAPSPSASSTSTNSSRVPMVRPTLSG